MINAKPEEELNRKVEGRVGSQREEGSESLGRTVLWILVSGACYYLATQIAWALCFPDSKVSLFFPPHAVLVSVLLLVPTRHWWAYTLVAIGGHFVATQQAHWPFLYSLHCEAFDAVQNISTAAGVRILLKSPLRFSTLRDAVVFILVAVVIVPFGTAFWGAAFTISNHFGTHYWVEWRNLGISNAVTAMVLVPAILHSVSYLSTKRMGFTPGRLLEAGLLAAGILTIGILVFDKLPTGPDNSPALMYAPIPLLIWATLRFGLGGMSLSLLVVTFQAIWGTMHGRGPFLMQAPAENALSLQGFLLVISIPLLFLAVMVEEEKRSQKALSESEERYREVVESQTDLVCRFRADSTLTFVNGAYCRFLGRRREELLGRKLLEFIPLHAREAVSNYIAALNQEQRAVTQEIEVTLPNQSNVWHLWTAYPVRGTDGEVLEFQAIGHDITARKKAETEVLRQRAELAHVARVSTMGELAASLAHELNQPLGAILANAEAAELFLQHDPPAFGDLRAILADIRKDDERAGEVIRRMSALLRKRELEQRPLEINSLVEDVLQLVSADAALRGVSLSADLGPMLPKISGDPVHLQQVLLNLILNGMDAMADQPHERRRITVRTRLGADGLMELAVIDSGHGIEPDKLPRLFETFYTTKPNGMGMGLSIARTIVEAHHGRIWAENNAADGAAFRVSLPAVIEGTKS